MLNDYDPVLIGFHNLFSVRKCDYFPGELPGNQGPRGRRLNETRSIYDSEVLQTRN